MKKCIVHLHLLLITTSLYSMEAPQDKPSDASLNPQFQATQYRQWVHNFFTATKLEAGTSGFKRIIRLAHEQLTNKGEELGTQIIEKDPIIYPTAQKLIIENYRTLLSEIYMAAAIKRLGVSCPHDTFIYVTDQALENCRIVPYEEALKRVSEHFPPKECLNFLLHEERQCHTALLKYASEIPFFLSQSRPRILPLYNSQ